MVPLQWPGDGWTTSPAGLFDDEHVGVLVQDLERDRLGLDVRRLRRGHLEDQRVARVHDGAGLERDAVKSQLAVRDQVLDPAPRESRQIRGDAVGAPARSIRDDEAKLGHPAIQGRRREGQKAIRISRTSAVLIAASATL